MELFDNRYRVQSARKRGWDYSTPGHYFVTFVTKGRIKWLGDIHQTRMHLSTIGEIMQDEWFSMERHRGTDNVSAGPFVVMPDHFHGIVTILKSSYSVEGALGASKSVKNDLGRIVGCLKSAVTWRARSIEPSFGWQARYWDRIIRDKEEYDRIARYIHLNPLMW